MLRFSIFRKNQSVFKVKMGGPETTDKLAQYLMGKGYDYVDGLITQENFPLRPQEILKEREIVICDPDRWLTKDEALAFLKTKGLLPPSYEDALLFARQHRKVISYSKKPFVIFLHEPWIDQIGNERAICLGRDVSRCPRLDLHYSTGWTDNKNPGSYGFDRQYLFAGVRLPNR